jgi:hypothetical protein
MIATMGPVKQDATRRRRYSSDAAKARWYALHRAWRWRRHFFGGTAPA